MTNVNADILAAAALAESDGRSDVAAKIVFHLSLPTHALRAEVNAIVDRLEAAGVGIVAAGFNGRCGNVTTFFDAIDVALDVLSLPPTVEAADGWMHVWSDMTDRVRVASCCPVAELDKARLDMLVAFGWDGQPRGGGR